MRFAMIGTLALLVPAAVGAQVRGPADLFPAQTVAYLELSQPDQIAKSLSSLVKGTPFADGWKILEDRRDANTDPRLAAGSPALAWAVSALSPELRNELSQLKGAAIGYLGLTAQHDPKIAACVVFDERSSWNFVIPFAIAQSRTLRRVATIDGVAVYQSRSTPAIRYDPETAKPLPYQPQKPDEGPYEFTCAFRPGLFVVASNREAIADLIASTANAENATIRSTPAYKTLDRNRIAGVMGFVRMAEIIRNCDVARRAQRPLIESSMLAYLKLVAGTHRIGDVQLQASLNDRGFVCQVSIPRRSVDGTPILADFSGAIVQDDLRFTPREAAGFLTLAMPGRAKRAKTIGMLADRVAAAEGSVSRSPSEWIANQELQSGIPIRAGVLEPIRAVSLIFVANQELPVRTEPLPVLAIHCERDTPDVWQKNLIEMLSLIHGQSRSVQTSTETLLGTTITSLSIPDGVWHLGRTGSTWILGRDRHAVARCCSASADRQRVAGLPKEYQPRATTQAIGILSWPGLLEFEAVRNTLNHWGVPSNGSEVAGQFGRLLIPPGILNEPEGASSQPLFSRTECQTLFGKLPPLTTRWDFESENLVGEVRWDFGADGGGSVLTQVIPILEKLGATQRNAFANVLPFDR